jgi:hypothetical protein
VGRLKKAFACLLYVMAGQMAYSLLIGEVVSSIALFCPRLCQIRFLFRSSTVRVHSLHKKRIFLAGEQKIIY